MEIVRKSPICGPARAESPTSPEPRATPWVSAYKRLRPVRAKVWANGWLLLLPLQGVGNGDMVPRALPWARDLLGFQPTQAYTIVCCVAPYIYHNLRILPTKKGIPKPPPRWRFRDTLRRVFDISYSSPAKRGSHAGRSVGFCSKSFNVAAGTKRFSTTRRNMYSSNHSSVMMRWP